MTDHQQQQKILIDEIDKQAASNSIEFTTVSPVSDYEKDTRLCLTSAHFPHPDLISTIHSKIITPLRLIEPTAYFYPPESLHMTIKTIRVIHDPPHFTDADIQTVHGIFEKTMPQFQAFNVYFYRLLLFPNSLSLIGTTDSGLDTIVLSLDDALTTGGVPDDKVCLNTQYFFSNMTLVRLYQSPSEEFQKKVKELSESLTFGPYQVDSVTLLTANAVMKNKKIRGIWKL